MCQILFQLRRTEEYTILLSDARDVIYRWRGRLKEDTGDAETSHHAPITPHEIRIICGILAKTKERPVAFVLFGPDKGCSACLVSSQFQRRSGGREPN